DALAPFAVSGPATWSDPRLSSPVLPSDAALNVEGEAEEEPESTSGAEFAFHPSSWDESSALAGTVPSDLTATPLYAIRPHPHSKTFATVLEEERRRFQLVLTWTAGVIVGVGSLPGLVYLWCRDH